MNTSSRATCGLYDARLRRVSPSKWRTLLGLLWEVAAEARRHPRRVAGSAVHLLRVVRTRVFGPALQLRICGLLVVFLAARGHGVQDLADGPLDIGVYHRPLDDLIAPVLE